MAQEPSVNHSTAEKSPHTQSESLAVATNETVEGAPRKPFPFLKRKSKILTPVKLDWSNVKPMVSSRLDAEKLQALKQQREQLEEIQESKKEKENKKAANKYVNSSLILFIFLRAKTDDSGKPPKLKLEGLNKLPKTDSKPPSARSKIVTPRSSDTEEKKPPKPSKLVKKIEVSPNSKPLKRYT